MEEISPFQREKRLKELIDKKRELFNSEHNKIKSLARMVPVLVLGDYPKNSKERNLI